MRLRKVSQVKAASNWRAKDKGISLPCVCIHVSMSMGMIMGSWEVKRKNNEHV